jgi:peroxiredoxin
MEPGTVVVFFYPKTGSPDSPPMPGWNEIPGARGCTPQTCSYRDKYNQLSEIGAKLFGASSQAIDEQIEAVTRLALPFELLNDSAFELTTALDLPTFNYKGIKMIKRLTLIIINGEITKVFYPVFPPDQDVDRVIIWLNQHPE